MDGDRRGLHLGTRFRLTRARVGAWFSASPRHRRRSPADTVHKLMPSEIGGVGRHPPRPAAVFGPEKFRNFQLQEEFDLCKDNEAHHFPDVLPFSGMRSRITKIIVVKDIIFALAHNGVCAAFHQRNNKLICYLNYLDELIMDIFYNKVKESIITLSTDMSDYIMSSNCTCRAIPKEFIFGGSLYRELPLLETGLINWRFDDVNNKALAYSEQECIYRVYDLKSYEYHTINGANVVDIKISLGFMLLLHERSPSFIQLKVVSIEDGTLLKTFNHSLHPDRKVEFVELINEKVLIKQESEYLQILDLRDFHVINVRKMEFETPSAAITLHASHRLLTIQNGNIAAWNSRGKLTALCEDHQLFYYGDNFNNIYITRAEDIIISYCGVAEGANCKGSPIGSINISSIINGKLIAKISPADLALTVAPRKEDDPFRTIIHSSVHQALHCVTSIFFDEDNNKLYTGNSLGLLHAWYN